MLIRCFVSTDADAVNAAALAAFAQYEGMYSHGAALMRGVGAMSQLAECSEIVVAEVDGIVAGAVAYFGPGTTPRAEFFKPEWPIIRMLVVDPAFRRRGIGRRLTEECISRGRRDGAAVIALHTSPAMEVALAMYLRMGFVLAQRVPDRFGVPYGLYLMPIQ
jgi:GNAT superfamily N-acetyltransferase